MNKKAQTLRHTSGNTRTDASKTGGKPDTVAKAASAAETLAAPQSATILQLEPATASVDNIFALHARSQNYKVEERQKLLATVKAELAEAKQLETAGALEHDNAVETSAKAGFRLYQGRIQELLSADEVSGILRETWGAKMKADGKPSNTPLGMGEQIRKRVVRAVGLHEFLTDGTGGNFFDGMPEDEAKHIKEKLDNGDLTINSAYEALAKAKSDNQTRVDPAFNPTAIAKMIAKLSEPTAASVIARSPGLIDAYTALIRTLNIVGAEAAAIAAKAAKPMEKGAVAA